MSGGRVEVELLQFHRGLAEVASMLWFSIWQHICNSTNERGASK